MYENRFVKASAMAVLLTFTLSTVQALSVFTEAGGEESFTTDDFDVYTTGTNGVGDRTLNLTGNVTGLSSHEDSVEVWFNVSAVGESSWRKVDAGTVSSEGEFSTIVYGLDQGTSYEFVAKSENRSGGIGSATTSTYEVYSLNAQPGTDWIEFRGNISDLSPLTGQVADEVTLLFDYKQVGASSWNTVNAGARSTDGNFSERVEGLQEDAEYKFRARSEDGIIGGSLTQDLVQKFVDSGGDVSFTTPDYSVNTKGTNGIGVGSVNFTGETLGLSDLQSPENVFFRYRETGSSSWSTADAGTVDGSLIFYRVFRSLQPSTEYEFEACTDHYCGGTDTFTTNDYTITTENAQPGTDWFEPAGQISGLSQFNSDVGDFIGLKFQWRKKGESTWNEVSAPSRKTDGFFRKRVEGLENGTTYEYRALSEHGKTGDILEQRTVPGVFTVSGGSEGFVTYSFFEVDIQDVSQPVIEGEEVQVDALVENTGANGSRTVSLDVSGLGSDSRSFSLENGESAVKSFSFPTSSGDEGEYVANVSSVNSFDTEGFSVSKLNPPVSPLPETGSIPVGLDWDLSAVSNTSAETGIEFYILNESGTDISVGGGLVSEDERFNRSLSSVDLDTGTEYEWYANATLNGQRVQSDVWNFTTVERPDVVGIEPSDGAFGVDQNPVLNLTVDGSAPVQAEFYDNAGDVLIGSQEVQPGDTASVNLADYSGMGEDTAGYWYVNLTSLGAEWNNADKPYSFSISDVSEVDYEARELQNSDNLNPGDIGNLEIIGPSKIKMDVTNPQSSDMTIGLNILSSSGSKQIVTSGVEDGSSAVFDLKSSEAQSIVEENSEYSLEAFYQEGTSRYTGSNFTSQVYDVTTNVAELNWTDRSPSETEEFRVYFNESDQAFNTFSEVGSIEAGSQEMEAGVANRGLDSDGTQDCYAVRAWRPGGGLSEFSTTDGNCIGGGNP